MNAAQHLPIDYISPAILLLCPCLFFSCFLCVFFPSELAIFMHQYWQSNNRSVKFQNETDFQKIKGKREERDFHSQFINKMTNMFTQSLESAFKISLQKKMSFLINKFTGLSISLQAKIQLLLSLRYDKQVNFMGLNYF